MSGNKAKPLEEWVRRYAEAALISAVRLRRYWLSQGLPEHEAVRRAVNQAVGMMRSSGLGPEELIELFKDLQSACNAFIKMLEKIVGESK